MATVKSDETKARERAWAAELLPYEFRHWHRPLGLELSGELLERWLDYAVSIEVELHPGGRATLSLPEGLTVEVRWGRREPGYTVVSSDAELPVIYDTFVSSIHVEASPGALLPAVDVPISACVAALRLALVSQGGPQHLPPLEGAERPAAGKRPAVSFYRSLVAEYDELIGEGHHSPVSELSRRHGVKPGTVKSWLHRGRRYLRGEKK